MKAVVTLLAVLLGTSLFAVVVLIQQNPLAYTYRDPARRQVRHEIQTVAQPVLRLATEADSPDLVHAVGSEPRQKSAAKQMAKTSRPLPPAPASGGVKEKAEPEIEVVPAPCIDGEYRQLDERRGVRVSCNGNP